MDREEFEVLSALAEGLTEMHKTEQRCAVCDVLFRNGYIDDNGVTQDGLKALEPYRVCRAVFLAAGVGSRLAPVTLTTPKPLVRVSGVRIIDTLLDAVLSAGIDDIYIVRGYLKSNFDELLTKYPMLKFVDNDVYNEANNIASAYIMRNLLENAYVLEADLLLNNRALIRRYQFASNYLTIPVAKTDDWCFNINSEGIIDKMSAHGGKNCMQMVGISYWSKDDGKEMAKDIATVYNGVGGRQKYWDEVALGQFLGKYSIGVRECKKDDVVEIDTYAELKVLDSTYGI